jgi:DNA-binding NarL/FixJ family response regulator
MAKTIVSMEKLITILIVDDNRFVREGLCMLLSDVTNFRLAGEAKNGEEAIALSGELIPDIVLMDINMSPVDGFEATRKILKHNAAINIIGLSLHNDFSYCHKLLLLGARGYLIKSTSHDEIIIAINEVAAGRKYIDKDLVDNF